MKEEEDLSHYLHCEKYGVLILWAKPEDVKETNVSGLNNARKLGPPKISGSSARIFTKLDNLI